MDWTNNSAEAPLVIAAIAEYSKYKTRQNMWYVFCNSKPFFIYLDEEGKSPGKIAYLLCFALAVRIMSAKSVVIFY